MPGFNEQQQRQNRVKVENDLPEMPRFPQLTNKRDQEAVQQWWEAMQQWYYDHSSSVLQKLEDLASQVETLKNS
jgi:hypothetical protein